MCVVMHNSSASFGIVINEKKLINKIWFSVYLLSSDDKPIGINFRDPEHKKNKSIFNKDNFVYKVDLNDIKGQELQIAINENDLFKNRFDFIGYVFEGSDINRIIIYSLLDQTDSKSSLVREGTILKTHIYGEEVLYQLIDGITKIDGPLRNTMLLDT